MRNLPKFLGMILGLIGLTYVLGLHTASANCQVNAVDGFNGTAGNDTVICDDLPAPETNPAVSGGAGSDSIVITADNGILIVAGDGTATSFLGGGSYSGGNDTIVIGTTVNFVIGDYLANFPGGNDVITLDGTAYTVRGDDLNGTAQINGADTITINGYADFVQGDLASISNGSTANIGGNDLIIINGTAPNVDGDNMADNSIFGNDTIVINQSATVNTVMGDNNYAPAASPVGGNDLVVVVMGATVTGRLDGGNVPGDFDTLRFDGVTNDTAGWNSLQALVGCNPCNGTITLGGNSYAFANFESLINLVSLLLPAGSSGGESVVINFGGTAELPAVQSICDDGKVKVFRQPNGDVDFYSGFDIVAPNGFLVGRVVINLLPAVQRFQDPGPANPGWYVEVSSRNNRFFGQVFDQFGNPIGGACFF